MIRHFLFNLLFSFHAHLCVCDKSERAINHHANDQAPSAEYKASACDQNTENKSKMPHFHLKLTFYNINS